MKRLVLGVAVCAAVAAGAAEFDGWKRLEKGAAAFNYVRDPDFDDATFMKDGRNTAWALTDEAHYARIEAMIENEVLLSREDFDYAVRFLQEHAVGAAEGRCLTMLADLYNQRADGYRSLAESFARRALAAEPYKKDNHCALCHAAHGAIADWNIANHHELIAFYQRFVQKHPDYRQGYLWLLDNLIDDGRLSEAEQALRRMAAVAETYHVPLYRGLIAARLMGRGRAA